MAYLRRNIDRVNVMCFNVQTGTCIIHDILTILRWKYWYTKISHLCKVLQCWINECTWSRGKECSHHIISHPHDPCERSIFSCIGHQDDVQCILELLKLEFSYSINLIFLHVLVLILCSIQNNTIHCLYPCHFCCWCPVSYLYLIVNIKVQVSLLSIFHGIILLEFHIFNRITNYY